MALLTTLGSRLRQAFPQPSARSSRERGALSRGLARKETPAPWLEMATGSASGVLDILRGQQVAGYAGRWTVEPSEEIIRRSRVLATLCPYGQRFLSVCRNEALGPDGIQARLESSREQRRWDELTAMIGVRGESLAQFMSLALDAYLRDGEAFILLVNRDGLRLQLIDALQVDVHDGILYDADGAPVEYRISERVEARQPAYGSYSRGRHIRYPASQVIHLYRRQLPLQRRGVSQFMPAWEALGWLWQLEDRTMANVRQSAETLGFYELPPEMLTPDFVDEEVSPDSQYSEVSESKIRLKIPKTVEDTPLFPNGMAFRPIDLGRNFAYGPQLSALRRELLSSAAASLGVSYAALAGEYSGANYSSLRQGRLDDIAFYKGLQAVVIGAQERVYDAWLMGQGRGVREWVTPHFAAVDPQREAQVSSQEIKSGIRSRSEVIRARGGDPDVVFGELERESEIKGVGGQSNGGGRANAGGDAGERRDAGADAGGGEVGTGGTGEGRRDGT